MDFDYILIILKREVNLDKSKIDGFRECIKNIPITEEQSVKIRGIIPEPWYLEKCPDDGKPAVYNKVAEIIDNFVAGFSGTLESSDIECLRDYKDITGRLIQKRITEINKSKKNITKEQYIYMPVIGMAQLKLEQLIGLADLK